MFFKKMLFAKRFKLSEGKISVYRVVGGLGCLAAKCPFERLMSAGSLYQYPMFKQHLRWASTNY